LAPQPAPSASRPAPQRAARPAARRVADSDDDGEDDDDESGGDGGDSDSEASFEVPGGSDSDAEDDPALVFATAQARKAANVKAMLTGQLTVQRAPLLPRLLTLTDAQEALRKPFKPPVAGSTATGPSGALLARSLCLCVWPESVCGLTRAVFLCLCVLPHFAP
jgi:DNA repair and recombination RAD54-like protein